MGLDPTEPPRLDDSRRRKAPGRDMEASARDERSCSGGSSLSSDI